MNDITPQRRDGALTRPPWNRPGTLYFYAGTFSNFAAARGLRLPAGWYGHPPRPDLYEIPSGEHWMQACKATSREDFEWVLSAPSPQSAKRRGSQSGEGGRTLELRPDWDRQHPGAPLGGPTKLLVVAYYLAARARHDTQYRQVLQWTGSYQLVEDSPRDFEWGGRDAHGGFTGRNLLGIAHMTVRAALPAMDAMPHGAAAFTAAKLTSAAQPMRRAAA